MEHPRNDEWKKHVTYSDIEGYKIKEGHMPLINTEFGKLTDKQIEMWQEFDNKRKRKLESFKNQLARYHLDNIKINPISRIKIEPNSYIKGQDL